MLRFGMYWQINEHPHEHTLEGSRVQKKQYIYKYIYSRMPSWWNARTRVVVDGAFDDMSLLVARSMERARQWVIHRISATPVVIQDA